MKTYGVVITFQYVDEILYCNHLNKTSLAVIAHGAICFSIFYEMKFEIFQEFLFLAFLGVNGLPYHTPTF